MTRHAYALNWISAALCATALVGRPLLAQETEAEKRPPAESAASAADDAAPATETEKQETPAATPAEETARQAFDAAFETFKNTLKELRTLQNEYQVSKADARVGIKKKFEELVATGNQQLPELQRLGVKAYEEAPNEDRELTRSLIKMLKDNVSKDQYQLAVETGNALIEHDCGSKEVFAPTGIANFSLNNFDAAADLLEKAKSAGAAGSDAMGIGMAVNDYKKFWKQEQELRAAEAEADDLPRVKLTTNKGEIELELFENEAPDTVGNFVNLVQNGFYDGLVFHRVLPGFMAQGGCPNGDGSGGPGYTIYDECKKPNARMHFRGSLSMAKTAEPNSGGSQFFITFRPTPHLNKEHTVFGRVIKGMDVVDSLQRTGGQDDANSPENSESANKPEPDKIIKAEVIRIREGKEYLPKKVE